MSQRTDGRKRMKTTRDLVIMYKGQSPEPKWDGVELRIPAGHPVTGLLGGQGWHYVADQPGKLLDAKTQGILLHDATYYGIPIPADAVTAVEISGFKY